MTRNRNNLARQAALAAACAMAILAPTLGTAQFTTGGDVRREPAWTQFRLDPNKTVRLNFRNANVDLVLDLYMRVSGITIVKDPNLNQPMTVSSPRPVRLNEAFEILDAALSLRNFEMVKQGNVLLIQPRRQREQGAFDPNMISQFMQGGNVELQVYRIRFASASEVARVINEVFIQRDQAQNPFAQFFGGGGGNRFGGNQGRGGRGGFPGGGGFPGFGGQQGPSVRASADDFSNSVIVNAPRDKQREVEALIEEIDQQTDQPLSTKVYKLEFADATQALPTIQSVLTANAPTGRGSTGRPQQGFGGFLSRIAGPGQGESSATADVRTNSLVVNATEATHRIVETLVREIDIDVPVENSTFVIPLSNARADSVAQLLNQAFGTRQANRGGQFGGGNFNNRNTNNRAGNNNRGGGGNFGGGNFGGRGGRGVTEQDGAVLTDQELQLLLDENDDLLTQVRAQQGGFFGQLGNQNRNQPSGLGRGADGRLTNVNSLEGQITVIPDPNTNSLIVITDPNNAQVVRDILNQLDRIPEQVMIETIIVEATLDKSLKLGVEWNFAQNPAFGNSGTSGSLGTNFGDQTANPPLQGLRYTLTGGNFSAFLNALATDDKFSVLSTPRIFTSNNVEAEINISQRVPFIVSTREDANGNLTFNYSFEDVGIVLNVVPRITSDGTVTLDVTQTANDLQGFTDFNAPIVNQRQAFTTVSVRDGETIVLGGMMRNTVTSRTKKLPILGDIPILGELFRSRSRQDVKTELLVFLTPRVVQSPEQAARLRSDQARQLSPEGQRKLDSAMGAGRPARQPGAPKCGPKNDSGR